MSQNQWAEQISDEGRRKEFEQSEKGDESGVRWCFQGVPSRGNSQLAYLVGLLAGVSRATQVLRHREHEQVSSVLDRKGNKQWRQECRYGNASWFPGKCHALLNFTLLNVCTRMLMHGLECLGTPSFLKERLVDPGQKVSSNRAHSWWYAFPHDFEAVVGSVLYLYNQRKESILEKTGKEGSWG